MRFERLLGSGISTARLAALRVIASVAGLAILLVGLADACQRINFVGAIEVLGWGGTVRVLVLASAAIIMGALAWAFVITSFSPGLTVGGAASSFLRTLPMRYLPGSIWSHVSRVSWYEVARPAPDSLTAGRSISGPFVVGVEFGLLLWSGLFTALLSGALSRPLPAPYGIEARIWLAASGLSLLVMIGLPFLLCRRASVAFAPSAARFVLRIWGAMGLQIGGWVAYGLVLATILNAMNEPNYPAVSAQTAIVSNYVSNLAGLAAIPFPGGVGIRELVSTLMLGPYVDPGISFASTLVCRLVVMVAEMFLLGFGVLIAGTRTGLGHRIRPFG